MSFLENMLKLFVAISAAVFLALSAVLLVLPFIIAIGWWLGYVPFELAAILMLIIAAYF